MSVAGWAPVEEEAPKGWAPVEEPKPKGPDFSGAMPGATPRLLASAKTFAPGGTKPQYEIEKDKGSTFKLPTWLGGGEENTRDVGAGAADVISPPKSAEKPIEQAIKEANPMSGLVNMAGSAFQGVHAALRPKSELPAPALADPRSEFGYRAASAVGPLLGMNPESAEKEESPGRILGQASVPAAAAMAPLAGEGIGEAAGALGRATKPARVALAEKMVGPTVRMTPEMTKAASRTGAQPRAGLVEEGIVGTNRQIVEKANARVAALKARADNILKTSPNAGVTIDAEPLIDQAIDQSIKAAKEAGEQGKVSALESLRDGLKNNLDQSLYGNPYDINNLKSKLQDMAAERRAYGGTDPAQASVADALSDAATAIKDKVNQTIPEVQMYNERMQNVISARDAVQEEIFRTTGKSVLATSMTRAPFDLARETIGTPLARTAAARAVAGRPLRIGELAPTVPPPTVPLGPVPPPGTPIPAPMREQFPPAEAPTPPDAWMAAMAGAEPGEPVPLGIRGLGSAPGPRPRVAGLLPQEAGFVGESQAPGGPRDVPPPLITPPPEAAPPVPEPQPSTRGKMAYGGKNYSFRGPNGEMAPKGKIWLQDKITRRWNLAPRAEFREAAPETE